MEQDKIIIRRKERYSAKIGIATTPKMRQDILDIAQELDVDYSVIVRECLGEGLKQLYGKGEY